MVINKNFYVEKYNEYDQLETVELLFENKIKMQMEMIYVGTIIRYENKKYIVKRIETDFESFVYEGIASQKSIDIYMEREED